MVFYFLVNPSVQDRGNKLTALGPEDLGGTIQGLSPNPKAWIRDVGRSRLRRGMSDVDNDEAWGSCSWWETRRNSFVPKRTRRRPSPTSRSCLYSFDFT
jgi:hypothetical protein